MSAGHAAMASRGSWLRYSVQDVTVTSGVDNGPTANLSKLPVDETETGKYVVFSFDELVDLSLVASLELR